MRIASSLLVVITLSAAGCIREPEVRRPHRPPTLSSLTLDGQFSIAPLGRYPEVTGLPFGGISALAPGREETELFGLSDVRVGRRIYTFFVEGSGGSLRVTTSGIIPLEAAPGGAQPDHEGLIVLPNGNFLVSSEGTATVPRHPPALEEYGRQGQFIGALTVPAHFVPEPTGEQTRGARPNAGFEALAISPDGKRIFVGTESALVQDGPVATLAAGTRVRILEYQDRDGRYQAAREFAYDLEPVHKPSYTTGTTANGLVELLALDSTTLLALERSYAQNPKDASASENRIRIYKISLAGATDISGIESLKDRSDVVPVTKTLVLDLSDAAGLTTDLAPTLDNFEGMTFGPTLPDGRASLVLVSDDNFNPAQRTWFLTFAIQ